MLAIGVNNSFEQSTSRWRRPGLLLRSLLAVVFLVPMVVVLLFWVFALPPAAGSGLAVLAARRTAHGQTVPSGRGRSCLLCYTLLVDRIRGAIYNLT